MARYRFSIDLGTFIGARYINLAQGEGKPDIPGIFIPAGINGIEVKADGRTNNPNKSGFRAFLNMQQRSCNYKFINAVKENLIRKGDTPTLYNVPAYDVCYTLPEEKRKVIRAALKKRVIAEHPDWANQADEKGTDLARAISVLMPFQLGDSYLIEEQNSQQQSASPSAPVTQGVSGYTPAAAAPADSQWTPPENPEDDDLPF